MESKEEEKQKQISPIGNDNIPLIIIAIAASGLILVTLKEVLLPFVIAIFFLQLLRPVVLLITTPFEDCLNWIKGEKEKDDEESKQLVDPSQAAPRREARCPTCIGVTVAFLLAIGFIAGISLVVADAVSSVDENRITAYETRAMRLANETRDWIDKQFGVDIEPFLKNIPSEISLGSLFKGIVMGIANAFSYIFLILLFLLYLLFEEYIITHGTIRHQIDMQLSKYILVKTLISATVGFLVFVALGPILHVDLAHLWAILTFFLNYIPNVGPIIATILPLPFVLLDPDLTATARLFAFIIPTVIHMFIGNWAEPYIFGHSLSIHPIIIIISLMVWYVLWGAFGAILSVPITAALRIILINIDHHYANNIVHILEGRLPGTNAKHKQSS